MQPLILLLAMTGMAVGGVIKLKPLTAEERQFLTSRGTPPVAGVHRKLPSNSLTKGKWKKTAGAQQWRLSIQSPGAKALRVRFENFDVGNAQVRVCEADGKRCYGPYSGKGPLEDRSFWSDTVDGETVLIELSAPTKLSPVPFQLPQVSHQN